MRSITCMTFIGLQLACGIGLAGELTAKAANPTAANVSRKAREQEKQVLASLSRQITVEAQDSPLIEVIQKISQLINREILLDRVGMADAGITTDQSVDLNLGEMTVSQTLHFLLRPHQLNWVANDGILEITVNEKADEVFVTRVYDVRNLCRLLEPLSQDLPWRNRARPRLTNSGGLKGGNDGAAEQGGEGNGAAAGGMGGGGFFNIPSLAISRGMLGQFGGMGGGLGGGVPSSSVPADSIPMGLRSVESLLARVIDQFPGLRWIDSDGEGGAIETGQGCLIVTQSYHGQFLIESFLKTLEQMVEGKPLGTSVPIRRLGYLAEEDDAIFAVLAEPKNLENNEEELSVVLQRIAKEAGFRLWIDKASLADAGISTDQNLTMEARNLPLGIGLKKILDPIQLSYVVEEGVVVVCTKDKAAEMLTLRLYDITNCDRATSKDSQKDLISILTSSTQGKWEDLDGEGGFAALISSRHLLVAQTQAVHAEIELLLTNLSINEPAEDTPSELVLRVYSTPDAETADDLLKILPEMLGNRWAEYGSMNRAGRSLLISQTSIAHDKIETILEALQRSQKRSPSILIAPATAPAAAVRPPRKHQSIGR